jgi:hypothetical protein
LGSWFYEGYGVDDDTWNGFWVVEEQFDIGRSCGGEVGVADDLELLLGEGAIGRSFRGCGDLGIVLCGQVDICSLEGEGSSEQARRIVSVFEAGFRGS